MKIKRFSQIIIFIYYVILLFNMVIFARFNSISSYNLVPFKSIIKVLQSGNVYNIVINIWGNLLIFMPLDYFLIELFKLNKFRTNFIISFIIIVVIELLQFIFRVGVFDIDDIILCTFGMMVFYLFYNSKHR